MEFLSQAAVTAGAVVLLVTEILKLKIVPLAFANKYPVVTNVILSIAATYFIVKPDFSWDNLGHLAVQVGTVAVIAAIAYNSLVRPSGVKSLEGENPNK